MNLIQKLESDISQAAEYGGIPNYYTRSELRKFLAALKMSQILATKYEEIFNELQSYGSSSKDSEYFAVLNDWKTTINL